MIFERPTRAGKPRFQVRIVVDGEKLTIGTFATRKGAENSEKRALRRRRRCRGCKVQFLARTEEQKRCDAPECKPTRAVPSEDGDFWLYRCLDANGELLYVGISGSGMRRLRTHGREKEWWPAVANVTVEHHSSRSDVLAAESLAIFREKPKHNRAHNKPGDYDDVDLGPGDQILASDGTPGVVQSEVNGIGNVLVYWADGLKCWCIVSLCEESRERWEGARHVSFDEWEGFGDDLGSRSGGTGTRSPLATSGGAP